MNTFSPPLPRTAKSVAKIDNLGDLKPAIEQKKPAPCLRTSQGLRDILFEEIELIRSGSKDYQRATSVANLAKQIVSAADLDLKYRNAVGNNKDPLESMKLGSK